MAEVLPPVIPGRLYRYRSLDRNDDAVNQEIDSILEGYLHCSTFDCLNDPMEGFYRPSEMLAGKTDYKEIVRQITDSKSTVGIASFTETNDNPLMWTHYANNYNGICVSYSTKDLLAGLPGEVKLVRLSYTERPPFISTNHINDAKIAAIRILSQKKANWAYEREWRLLGPVGKVYVSRLQPVRKIYFGSRISLTRRNRILRKIQDTPITAYVMKVNGYKHTWKKTDATATR